MQSNKLKMGQEDIEPELAIPAEAAGEFIPVLAWNLYGVSETFFIITYHCKKDQYMFIVWNADQKRYGPSPLVLSKTDLQTFLADVVSNRRGIRIFRKDDEGRAKVKECLSRISWSGLF